MDDELILTSVGGFGAVHKFHGVSGDRCVVWREVEVLGGKLVDKRVDLYDRGIDAVDDEGGWGGTDA